jgi:hypothetical protein
MIVHSNPALRKGLSEAERVSLLRAHSRLCTLPTKVGTVMLSAAKHLFAHRERPFAEFTLSGANVLRVTNHSRSWLVKSIIGLWWMFRYPDYKVTKHNMYQKADPASIKKIWRKRATVAPYFISIKNQPRKNKKIRRKCATVAPYSMFYRFLCNALQRASQKAKNTAQMRHSCTIFFRWQTNQPLRASQKLLNPRTGIAIIVRAGAAEWGGGTLLLSSCLSAEH